MKTTSNYEAIMFSQRHRNAVYEEVVKALERAAEEKGISRADIAKTLGYSKSNISQLLAGPGNWTLDTVSNLLFAIDAEMRCSVVFFSDCPKANRFHSAGEIHKMDAHTPPKPITGSGGAAGKFEPEMVLNA
jgi:DNA-binding phage protein